MVVLSNLLFLPVWGISGAALASALSKLVFVVLNMWFLYYRLGIHPLKKFQFLILAAGFLSYFLVFVIPLSFHWGVNLLIKSFAITLLYVFFLKIFRVVKDLPEFLRKF
jgi:O-antigen/teichoic acid export membrane protein